MLTAVIALALTSVALLVDRSLSERRGRQERAALIAQIATERQAADDERRALVEHATDERRELLTRLQHPELIVTRSTPDVGATVAPPEDDEWGNVGMVLPTIEADEAPAAEDDT